jgi:hypothetical protein
MVESRAAQAGGASEPMARFCRLFIAAWIEVFRGASLLEHQHGDV